MAELNLKQIIDRLNAEFTGDTRKLVFWYDDKAEFAEDIDSVELTNAKIYKLEPDNQFITKRFLEREDTTTNYLIYAPFPKPDVKDNHLEDTMLYSKRFFADRASLLSVDLGIEERYKPIIEKHIKFFARKERTQRFYDLEIENFNEENILVGLLSAVCKTRTCSFEEVLRVIITDGTLDDNKFLAEMEKYDLLSSFWKLCEQQFGYRVNSGEARREGGLGRTDEKPTLEKLIVTMFVTATARQLGGDMPQSWKSFVSYKSGNIIAFLDNLMNSVLYSDRFDELSKYVSDGLNTPVAFAGMQPEELTEVDTFIAADQILVNWIVERLIAEDIGAKLDRITIPELCEKRMKMHFGSRTEKTYQLLLSAYHLITAADYSCPDGFKQIIKQYQEKDYQIDQEYRKFYYRFDKVNFDEVEREGTLGCQIEDTGAFEDLRTLVENIYTNEYLGKIMPKWNDGIQESGAFQEIPLQRDFYNRYIRSAKERTVVIISDAMRYEVGQELFKRMLDDPKCSAKLEAQLSVLPSYTRLGMAALLPHRTLTMADDFRVLADDVLCNDLAGRQTVLHKHQENGICVQFDDIKGLKKNGLRDIFTGKQVVYVYHNQIDARGDKTATEDEVFVACEEAVREIMDLIRKISTNANTYRFLVTSDHGFIYKRDKISESEKVNFALGGREAGLGRKIGAVSDKKAFINRRFIVALEAVIDEGVQSMSMGQVLDNDDTKVVSFPVSSNVFKVAGGGQNFVHGGSSPQEMLVPVLDIKMERGHMETRPAQIALVSIVQKITNLITSMDFIQSDAVSDTVKKTTYKMYFISEDNERISNENIYIADSRDADPQKRIFRMRFTFKNKKYDKNKQYYLVVYDDATGIEAFRHPVIMDLAFADDFGFSI